MEINTDPQKIEEVIHRGVDAVFDVATLPEKLKSGKQLRIKMGIDPTAPDIHLGHSVGLRKLAQFQKMGHKAVLIIGDFTTLIGDPSGRTTSRPPLTPEQIRDNMKDYIKQAAKVIDIDAAEVHYNSEWFGQKPMSFLMDLAGRFTVARLIERDDFQKRLKAGIDVSMLELLYPLLQGYDSVAIRADVELGGHDQWLNLLFGRKVQRVFGQPEQDVMTVPLLIGIDGAKKMSKSVGNYIKINEEPIEMFCKIMQIGDDLVWNYFELLTDMPKEEIENNKEAVREERKHPRDVKMELAKEIVAAYNNSAAAEKAMAEFVSVKQRGKLPSEIPSLKKKLQKWEDNDWAGTEFIEEPIIDLVMATGYISSTSEARRLIEQGGVRVDDNVVSDLKEKAKIKKGSIIQIGKNKFSKID